MSLLNTVSIIGSCGRGDDAKKWNSGLYLRAMARAHEIITEQWKLDPTTIQLVSGGAAYADHIAVDLFECDLGYHSIKLYLPCEYDTDKQRFADIEVRDFRTNPGGTSNYYHSIFSKALGKNTLAQIANIKQSYPDRVELDSNNTGFHNRNTRVAKSQYMIASTFGEGDQPKDGGTADTWRKKSAETIAIHVSLTNL